tara:strand:+ start:4151 stop:4894 length:744 start_codon:yes stop_codon:yes gene_type:complete
MRPPPANRHAFRAQYEVSDDQDSVQMLQRSSQIGEFYRMSPPEVFDINDKLPPSYMDIMCASPGAACCAACLPLRVSAAVFARRIYDEESDRHVHITFADALAASCYGAAGGPNKIFGVRDSDLFDISNFDDDSPAGRRYKDHFATVVGRAGRGTPPATLSAVKRAYYEALGSTDGGDNKPDPQPPDQLEDGAQFAVSWALKCVELGVWCPVELVVTRPFIEHLMLSAIVTVAGRDTGATLFGPADM